MRRSLPGLLLLFSLALVIAGCGSGSDSASSSSQGQGSTRASTPDTSTQADNRNQSGGGESNSSQAPGGGGGSQSGTGGSPGGHRNANGAPLGANTAKPGHGDNSIQTYGFPANAAQKAAVVAAMRSFEGAVASGDWAKVCDRVSQRLSASLEKGGKKCAATAEAFLGANPITARFARHAIDATISSVRIGPTTAFVLFRPSGANHVHYLVFRREGSAWKALGLTTGNPLNPIVPAG